MSMQNKSSFFYVSDIIKEVQKNGITKIQIEQLLDVLLSKKGGKLLITYDITENGFSTARFSPSAENIAISLKKMEKWLNQNMEICLEETNCKDPNILKSYLLLYGLSHEVAHSDQYLMAKGIIDSPNEVLKNAYQCLFDLLTYKNYIIPRPVKQTKDCISILLYRVKQYFYLIERNADVESTNYVSKFAQFQGREDMHQFFQDLTNTFLRIGYMKSERGSIEETYRQILMYGQYKKFFHEINMFEEERVQYGFSIKPETRAKVLSKTGYYK